jgi:hypothetical protein
MSRSEEPSSADARSQGTRTAPADRQIDRWHGEEVNSDNLPDVILEEGLPGLKSDEMASCGLPTVLAVHLARAGAIPTGRPAYSDLLDTHLLSRLPGRCP